MNDTNEICYLTGRLKGKIALITGANVGCGLELTAELARRGATVIMGCRDLCKGQQSIEEIICRYGEQSQRNWLNTPAGDKVSACLQAIKYSQLILEPIDLASLNSIRHFANAILNKYCKIDILIHNAGIMATSYMVTEDGYELQLGVNHLGPVLLTELLLPLLCRANPARVIVVASNLYKQGQIDMTDMNLRDERYGPFKAYNQSKLANIMFVKELAERFDPMNIIPMAVHPGAVRTEISFDCNKEIKLFLRAVGISPWEGAQTALYCCLCPKPIHGGYYSNCAPEEVTEEVQRLQTRKYVWTISRHMVGLPP